MYEFHVSRLAREKYDFDLSIFRFDGNVVFTNFFAARIFSQKINQKRDLVNFPEQAVKAGDINAIGLIDEILHMVVSLYRKNVDNQVMIEAYDDVLNIFGQKQLDQALSQFIQDFPPISVFNGEISPEDYLNSSTSEIPNRVIALEEMMMLWITNRNPAVNTFSELFDDSALTQKTIYRQILDTMQQFFKTKPNFGPDNQDLYTMLRSPAIEEPYSLSGQLEYIRRKWGALLGDYLYRLLNSLDLIREENKAIFAGPGPSHVLSFESLHDEENFSPDSDWMPRTVMIAKNTYVWLYQLSETYKREIKHLDQIPDEELDKLASWGFNGLWLIGLWERSQASQRIKQLCGNPEAVASAYSLKNYAIAHDLGGEASYERLREKAWRRGIRLASDMVPNHMGIDSDWVVEHPDWFLSLPYSPFPAYSFNGPDLSPVDYISINIEDHYYDRTDAAVVFKRFDKRNGDTRFIYHGNDGTSMPWNDTAQLDYLRNDVREAVVQTILHVARKFPIIRFDAAMTLAKKHFQRLWFPQPGSGGDIASRAEHGLIKEQFDQAFPQEFWREVVERVAQEIPDTLLLAEAFWMMEGFFVRTLGMHRVYNSAFMNMLRNEDNAKYRMVIKNTLEFDPEILKRYVNFMNNPDEKTAVEQFGKGDKYFGICTLMSTMPGLPMFGHGQIEGFAEKYGMEYYRPYWEERSDQYLVKRHSEQIFPLLKRREIFSGVQNFLLYDFYTGEGRVNEDVFAYSNSNNHQYGLVIYHNRYESTKGWIHHSASYLNKDLGYLENKTISEGLKLKQSNNAFLVFKDNSTGLEYIRSAQEVRERGLFFDLGAYECHVFIDFRVIEDNDLRQYAQLNNYLNGRGVPSVEDAIRELMLAPILDPLRAIVDANSLKTLFQLRVTEPTEKVNIDHFHMHGEKFQRLIESINGFVRMETHIKPIVREEQRGLEAILHLNVFGEHYPFPGSEKYHTTLEFIKKNLGKYPFSWYVLFIWNDLRLMGRVITSEFQFAEISRSWIDEWGITRLIEQTMEKLGFDYQQSQSGVTILKLLIRQQNWILKINEQTTPASLVETLLSEEDVRIFLGINRYRGKLYFNKEAFESMMWWLLTISLIRLIADPETSLTEDVEKLINAFSLISEILLAEEKSDYQVDKLLDSLK
jgi:glycosidase